jgi:hypothetical protein
MSKKFLQTQANLMFEKTLYDYLEELQEIYLRDTKDLRKSDSWQTKEIHRQARSKMNLLNRTAKKHGLKEFSVPYFIEIVGNA